MDFDGTALWRGYGALDERVQLGEGYFRGSNHIYALRLANEDTPVSVFRRVTNMYHNETSRRTDDVRHGIGIETPPRILLGQRLELWRGGKLYRVDAGGDRATWQAVLERQF